MLSYKQPNLELLIWLKTMSNDIAVLPREHELKTQAMKETREEQRKIAVTRLELVNTKQFEQLKTQMLVEPIRARKAIEELRKRFMLKPKLIQMFIDVDMVQEYTNLLNRFNKLMDGDLR